MKLESLLLGAASSQDISSEIKYVKDNYSEEVKIEFLLPQFDIFRVLMKNEKLECFSDILEAVKELHPIQKQMISEIINVCVLLQVNPATSATVKRSFSTARRIKTWLRAKMTQKRFNHVTILNTHKDRTDKLRLLDVGNEFFQKNDRKRNFGKFTAKDLHHAQR